MTTAPAADPDLAAVLALAARGWHVFPCRPRDKTPLVKQWQHVATTDPNQIGTWFEENSACNFAVACGPGSGIWALDIDGEVGAAATRELCREYGEDWMHTLATLTARGRHLYFSWPANGAVIRNSAGKLASGLDVRGEGGYVVVPPSVHDTGHVYRWLDPAVSVENAPAWLLEMVAAPARKPIPSSEIGVLPQGRRNDGLTRLGGALRRKGAPQSEIETALREANERRCRPPLSDSEVRTIAASVSRYPSGGPDPLEIAWHAIENEVHPSRYARFLALCHQLQVARPAFPIVLPLSRIDKLMNCHWTQVRRWRRRAVQEERLKPIGHYIPHRRAGQYSFVECPTRDVPLGVSVPLRSPSSGLVGHSGKLPSGTADSLTRGGKEKAITGYEEFEL